MSVGLLAELLLTARGLVQAEARQLKRNVRRFIVTAVVVGACIALLLMLGLGLVIWGAYVAFAGLVGAVGGAFIVGGICILLAAILVIAAHLSGRR